MDLQTALFLLATLVVVGAALSRLRPRGNAADLAITRAVNDALAREFAPGTAHIDVKTFDGVVVLGGTVREFAQLERAVEIAGKVPGVKSVDRRVSVRSGT